MGGLQVCSGTATIETFWLAAVELHKEIVISVNPMHKQSASSRLGPA